ncbi:DUF2066 domain-containing protein [Solilutibacter silvestris]|uniref:DUF2066 domain-containing protein n=1 Tax=Solilutibacter silvestris TaxID=1645665 RepID=A0A2K1Q2W7_9GAMM|nr:DUF2066 domain-containing protein [Lysobacter silvestris]PNS09385.1 hypothetical protein Lysil_1014 [Lysobacter silvestris]
MRAFKLFCCACLLALAMPVALAQRVEGDRASAEGQYATEVVVRNQSEAERNNGFSRALLKVLSNVSGERNPIARPGVADEIRNAKDYVTSFDFRQDEGVSTTGAPTFKTMLVVRFNPAKVTDLVARTGMSSWPEPRPKPVLWLAIDDGSGPRLVGLAQANAARPVLDRAKGRGYRLGLPTGSASEQVMAGSIWRSDVAAVARASAAYDPPMQLVGKLYRTGASWRGDWVFVDKGKVLARSSTSNADARVAMAGGADIAADALIRKYARPGKPVPKQNSNEVADFTIQLVGINSSEDYLRAMAWLESQPQVKRVVPVDATADGMHLRISVAGGGAGLATLAANGGVMVPEAAPASTSVPDNSGDGKKPAVDTDKTPPLPTVYRVR